MTSRIVAMPLLAAIWLVPPAYAAAQEPDARVITMPVVAEPGDTPVRPVAPRFKEAMTGDSPEPAATTAAAEQRGNRGGGDRGGRSGGGQGRRTDSGGGQGRRTDNGGGRTDNGGGGQGRRTDSGGGVQSRSRARAVVDRRAPVTVVNYNTYRRSYYPPVSYDRWVRRTYGWSPLAYAPWAWIYGTAGYASFGYSYGGYSPYGYGSYGSYGPYDSYGSSYGSYRRPSTFDTGGVRLKVRPRDAEVFVDGYYAGLVDDFDGVFQELRLEQGGHKIEVRMPGFETLYFDVHVQAGRTIDLREDLRPRP